MGMNLHISTAWWPYYKQKKSKKQRKPLRNKDIRGIKDEFYSHRGLAMRLIDADRIPWQQMHPCHDSLYATKADIDRLPTVELPLPRNAAFGGMPTADVEPVRHAYWIKCENHLRNSDGKSIMLLGYVYECPLCGRKEASAEPYCNCGAKMDEGEKK